MADKIRLEVVTPDEAVFAEEVDEVVLPGTAGQFGVLPGHLPLLTSLDIGEMLIRDDGQERTFVVVRGFAEILDDTVSVLTRECEGVSDIDVERARDEVKVAEEELADIEERAKEEDLGQEMVDRYREALKRARIRLIASGDLGENRRGNTE